MHISYIHTLYLGSKTTYTYHTWIVYSKPWFQHPHSKKKQDFVACFWQDPCHFGSYRPRSKFQPCKKTWRPEDRLCLFGYNPKDPLNPKNAGISPIPILWPGDGIFPPKKRLSCSWNLGSKTVASVCEWSERNNNNNNNSNNNNNNINNNNNNSTFAYKINMMLFFVCA